MHDLACTLRPVPNGALTPPPGPGAARNDRHDPYGALTATWDETFPFMFTTAATSVETQRSRVIHGAFQIVNLTSNSQGSASELNSLLLAVGDDDTAHVQQLGICGTTFAPMNGDTGDFAGAFPSQTSYLAVPLGFIHRGGTARLVLAYRNTNAATRAVMAIVTIRHLRPAAPHENAWTY